MKASTLTGATLVVALALFGAACGDTSPSDTDAAAAEVEAVMQSFLDALEARDWDAARERVSQDFHLLEDGRRMTWSQARAMIEEAGFEEAGWTLSGFDTRIVGDVAYTTYDNHGRFVVAEDTLEVEFLESAVLRSEDGTWRIALLHSSVVPDEGEGPGPDAGDASGLSVDGSARTGPELDDAP